MASGIEKHGTKVSALSEYRSAIGTFAGLIAAALIFLWISGGTALHPLAIGIMLSSVTLAIALALFEVCWRLGQHFAEPDRH